MFVMHASKKISNFVEESGKERFKTGIKRETFQIKNRLYRKKNCTVR